VVGMDRSDMRSCAGAQARPRALLGFFSRSLQENRAFLGGTGDTHRELCVVASRPALHMSLPSAVCASLPSPRVP
jgi:hypothetical protein